MRATALEPSALRANALEPTALRATFLEPSALEPSALRATALRPIFLEPSALEPSVLRANALEPSVLRANTLEPNALRATALGPTALEPTALRATALVPTPLVATALRPTALRRGKALWTGKGLICGFACGGWKGSISLRALANPWVGAIGAAFLLWGGTAGAATVVSVDTGDTLRVREGGVVRTVRLACLDAPELAQAPQGARAKEALQRLLPVGSAVSLNPPTAPAATTVVAEVSTGAGNVNLELVRGGQAFTLQTPPPFCDLLRYAEAENTAQFRRVGVWQVEGGIQRPWHWRTAQQDSGDPMQPSPLPREPRLGRRDVSPSTPPRPSYGQPQALPSPPGKLVWQRQQCVPWLRQQFQTSTNGNTLPTAIATNVCTCLTSPKRNDTSERLLDRCMSVVRANIYQKCMVDTRKEFLRQSKGMPPPGGLLEKLCTCLTSPKSDDTPNTLAQRCQMLMLKESTEAVMSGPAKPLGHPSLANRLPERPHRREASER